MDAPSAGPISAPSAPATPSNFADVVSARALAAESTGGMYQPNAGAMPPPNQGGANWAQPQQSLENGGNQGAKLGDFQYDDPLAVRPDRQLQQNPQQQAQQQPEASGENAPPTEEAQPEVEQLYDENGEPIDMQAYTAQRNAVMTAMQQALDTGKLPYDALKAMSLEVEVNGEKREVSLEEARGGYMRRAAYTRELEKAYGLQQDAQNMLQLERLRNQEWQDHKQLRAGLKMLGLENSFMKAAFEWAKERVTYMNAPPAERALMERIERFEAERDAWTAQQRQHMQQQQIAQRNQPDPNTLHIQKQLEQLMPRMFKMHGIGSYPLAQQTFIQQLQAYCPDGVLTAERANEAALATKEWLADMDRIRREQTEVNPQSPGSNRPQRWLGPGRLSPGPQPNRALPMGNVLQASPPGAGQRGGRRPSDFVRRMGLG